LIVCLCLHERRRLKRTAERIGVLGTLHAVRMRSWDAHASRAEGDDLPPPRLRSLVGGSPDGEWLVAAGRSSATALRAAALKRGFDLDDPSTAVLDFGCGCGRASRHWQRPIHGTDIRPELVACCREHLPGDYAVNDPEPPTCYPDSFFDLVYAVSFLRTSPKSASGGGSPNSQGSSGLAVSSYSRPTVTGGS
jgi:Methyltransferase domain